MSLRLQTESEIDRERFPKFYVDVDEGPYVGIYEELVPEPPDPEPEPRCGDYMTIAAGFCCEDGIVLAADQERSTSFSKVRAQKIFVLPPQRKVTGAIVGSGTTSYIKMAIENIVEGIKDTTTLKQIEKVVKREILDLHEKHFYIIPEKADRPSVSLLIALWIQGEKDCVLLKTSQTSVSRVRTYDLIGVGKFLATCLIDTLCELGGSCEDAALSAICVVGLVKSYVPGCGGSTDIVSISRDGTIRRAVNYRIEAAEEFFAGFMEDAKLIFSNLTVAKRFDDVPEINMKGMAESVRDYIIARRGKPILPERGMLVRSVPGKSKAIGSKSVQG
jgi:hypothetical protein